MACYYPLHGYRSRRLSPSGRRPVVFDKAQGFLDMPISVPCGRCIGCRLERSRQWAVRIMHETSLHPSNLFVTLTYDDEHLPVDGSLVKPHLQKFIKRLRARRPPKTVRFFACGEYGDASWRPHYHAILFGVDFNDKEVLSDTGGHTLWTSTELSDLWPAGFSTAAPVTFQSAAYVARYSVKKINGEKAHDHYQVVDPSTGEVNSVEPEFGTMSLKPGIGGDWFHQFKDDVFPDDFVVVNGHPCRPPKYYFDLYEREASELDAILLRKRRNEFLDAHAWDHTVDRLTVREKVAKARYGLSDRNKL